MHKSRPQTGESANAPAGSYARTQVIPQTNLTGASSQPQERLIITEASGTRASSTSYSAATMAGRVSLYQFMPLVSPAMSPQAAPGNAIVAGFPFYWFLLYRELCSQMRRDKFPLNPAAETISQANFIKFITDISSVYGGLRCLQSIINSPAYNTPLGTMIETVTGAQLQIKGLFDQFNAIGMPPLLREIIDASVGVFCPEPTGPVIVVTPSNGVYAAGTCVDLSSSASLTTYLNNILATIQAIVGTADEAQAANAFATAYGMRAIGDKGVNSDQRCYDMWLTRAWSIEDSTTHNFWSAPSAPLDSAQRVPLLTRRNTWTERDLVSDMYSSLFRATPVSQNNNVANASAEPLGFFTDNIGVAGATVVEWFNANNSIGVVISGNQAVTTGITLTDPVSWEFPWAAIAAFETTTYAGLRNPEPDFEIVETNITKMADNASELINQVIATGYTGSSFTPASMA